jgi:hypothetical protein
MKPLTHVLPISMTFAAIFLMDGCTKQLDLDKSSGELRHCPIEKMISTFARFDGNPLDSVTSEIDFFYNTAGNPDSIISPRFFYAPVFYYFRYDRQNRLTDYQIAYSSTADPVVWHRYSYLRNGDILDSEYAYVDTFRNASHPPASSFEGTLTTYHLDGKGRVVKSTETFPLSPGTGPSIGIYDYDANGDLILPGTTYDNKINPIQTNSVWMFLSLNYSVHNPVAYNGIRFAVFTYDSYGLPTARVHQANTAYFNQLDLLAQFYGDNTSISYGCDLGQPQQ